MPRKRIVIAVGLLTATVCIGLVALLIMPDDRRGVTKANFARIENGMTFEDLDRILGDNSDPGFRRPGDPRAWAYWHAEDGSSIAIGFLEGRVAGKEWNGSGESMMKRLIQWVRGR